VSMSSRVENINYERYWLHFKAVTNTGIPFGAATYKVSEIDSNYDRMSQEQPGPDFSAPRPYVAFRRGLGWLHVRAKLVFRLKPLSTGKSRRLSG